tara:strand:+ start:1395 stop:1712 length:318 start_codon:yes stop_codon:yes gene_type:complete
MADCLRFLPGEGSSWSEEDMSLIIHYIQFIRASADVLSPYHHLNYSNEDFQDLSKDFKDLVLETYLSDQLQMDIEVYPSKEAEDASWLLPGEASGRLAVWQNGAL